MTGLEPATDALEVHRATFAPHGRHLSGEILYTKSSINFVRIRWLDVIPASFHINCAERVATQAAAALIKELLLSN